MSFLDRWLYQSSKKHGSTSIAGMNTGTSYSSPKTMGAPETHSVVGYSNEIKTTEPNLRNVPYAYYKQEINVNSGVPGVEDSFANQRKGSVSSTISSDSERD